MNRAFLASLLLLLVACVDPPPQLISATPTPSSRPTLAVQRSTPAIPPPAATTPAPDAWQKVAQQLEAENRQLTAERDYWKGETARYQQGLERAVKRLNEVYAVAVDAQARAAAAAAAPPPQPHVWAGTPEVQIFLDNVLVTGILYNWGDAAGRGEFTLELVLNGAVVDSRRLPLEVGARSQSPFSASFPLRGSGTYYARVRF